MKNLITLIILLQTIALASLATPVDLAINEQSLTCSSGSLAVKAPGISQLVAEFKVASLEHPCFFRIYLIDKSSANGGNLNAEVQVMRTTVQEPIYKCPPKPCAFCDPGECQIVGHRDSTEETIYIDILGLRFSAKSKTTNP